MSDINYVFGDVTNPQGAGPRVICSLSNDQGGWGAGLVLQISKRWREPERQYRRWHRAQGLPGLPFELGQTQFVPVSSELYVANILGQHGYYKRGGPPAVRYDALRQGLARVREFAEQHGASVHLPRIGCGLAGGSWAEVEPIIREELCAHGVEVTVYDLPPRRRQGE